jgi:hypothetical protein
MVFTADSRSGGHTVHGHCGVGDRGLTEQRRPLLIARFLCFETDCHRLQHFRPPSLACETVCSRLQQPPAAKTPPRQPNTPVVEHKGGMRPWCFSGRSGCSSYGWGGMHFGEGASQPGCAPFFAMRAVLNSCRRHLTSWVEANPVRRRFAPLRIDRVYRPFSFGEKSSGQGQRPSVPESSDRSEQAQASSAMQRTPGRPIAFYAYAA